MMAVMTLQPPLPLAPVAPAIVVNDSVALVVDAEGGRVFLHGNLVFAWDAGDDTARRLAAVQLVNIKAATQRDVAVAFGVDEATVHRWRTRARAQGAAALVTDRPGPRGPSKVTEDVVADIVQRRVDGASLSQIASAVGVSPTTVARIVNSPTTTTADSAAPADSGSDADAVAGVVVPLLPDPVDRSSDRVAARWGWIDQAPPVFTPAGRVPLVGMFAMFPALAATGLLDCAREVFAGEAALPGGFYGLDAMLIEGVARALLGQARAEASTRVDPIALGRVLGLDRAPEVKTIRRRINQLAATGKAEDLLAAIATRHLKDRPEASAVVFVDGHVRAYTGTKRIAKTHSARLKFPAPATVETWVSDAHGDPVLVVMAEPGAALAGELRRLLPELRGMIADDRRVLVGFDRGGWSPQLFADMHACGFDTLTWRKGPTEDIDLEAFTEVTHVDDHGTEHTWLTADTMVELPLGDAGTTFRMRQVTRTRGDGRQIHLLTTRTDLPAAEVIWRMGSRWRQENYFRYARIRFDLDSHDTYTATDDDPDRLVPNPARAKTHAAVAAARARLDRVSARTDADLLALHTPPPGLGEITIANADINEVTAAQWAADDALRQAQAIHRATPARVPLREAHPGQQVLDTGVKLIHHAIRMAAFNTATAIARAIRTETTYARADQEAHALTRAILVASGDIIPGQDTLTLRLDPLATPRATAAMAELCEVLTATGTTYPGTDLTLRYEAKNQP